MLTTLLSFNKESKMKLGAVTLEVLLNVQNAFNYRLLFFQQLDEAHFKHFLR